MKRLAAFALALGALVPLVHAGPASAGGPAMLTGAAEDVVKQDTLPAARARLAMLRLAGFTAVRVTSIWAPGLRTPTPAEQRHLANLSTAARLTGVRVLVSVYSFGSRTTPLTDHDQGDFAAYAASIVRRYPGIRDVIVGNEPNLNRFWMPQFGAGGANVAAPAYLSLLARTYDAIKAAAPDARVIGGALAPRGIDRPNTGRDTHSPTAFIADLGTAYRSSGRQAPVMDAFAMHPYEDNSSIPPSATHPNSTTIAIADYGKLVALLGQAFDGTAQAGSTLPIVYGEFGVETQIPGEKAIAYSGKEIVAIKPVDETTQARYYRDAVAMAFCQPTVSGIFLFHAIDEGPLDRLQSGVYYADGTPKSSLEAVRTALRDARGGVIARCEGMELTPSATVAYPTGAALAGVPLTVKVTCDVDCTYRLRLEKLSTHSTTLATSGKALAGEPTVISLPPRRVARTRYRFTLRLTAPVNTGPPARLASEPFTLP